MRDRDFFVVGLYNDRLDQLTDLDDVPDIRTEPEYERQRVPVESAKVTIEDGQIHFRLPSVRFEDVYAGEVDSYFVADEQGNLLFTGDLSKTTSFGGLLGPTTMVVEEVGLEVHSGRGDR